MRSILDNKAGKTSKLLVFGVIASLIILSVIAYGVLQTGYDGDDGSDATTPGACSIDTTVEIVALNALDKSSEVTVTPYAIVDDIYVGSVNTSTDTFVPGDEVTFLLSASNYIDKVLEPVTLKCGKNRITAEIYATDDMSISVKTDAGTSVLTDAASGGAVNESAFSAGGSKTWEVTFTGTDKQSSGDLTFVVELGSDTNVSSVTMSDASGQTLEKLSSVPSGLTVSGTNLHRAAFVVPAFQNAVKKVVYVNVAAATSKLISGAVYMTAYSQQTFVDTDSTFKTGVVNADGTTKYEDDYDYDFLIASS